MFFTKIKTPGIAQFAYMVGDGGQVAVVDPRRDVDVYLEMAQANGLTIAYVIETHRHEDFVMGSAEIARRAGAKIVSGDHPRFGRSEVRLCDGEPFALGSLTLRALHTPGHTPESTCYALSVEDAPGRALGVFTGDTLLIGETGRVDLTREQDVATNAGVLFDSVHDKLAPLGDQTIVWPAHGAGSVSAAGVADRDESTLGFERAYNRVFVDPREAFVAAKVRERMPIAPYFAHVENLNRQAGAPAGRASLSIPLLGPSRFAASLKNGGIAIDTRDPEAFAGGHVPRSINIWRNGLAKFGGWVATPESRVHLVVDSMDHLDEAVRELERLGIDGIEGVLAGGFEAWRDAGMPIAYTGTTDPRALERTLANTVVLDVREESEFAEGHIEGALHVYVGELDAEIERMRPALMSKPMLVVACSVGHRSGIAVSLLRRHGIRAENLLGGMTAWNKLGLPTAI